MITSCFDSCVDVTVKVSNYHQSVSDDVTTQTTRLEKRSTIATHYCRECRLHAADIVQLTNFTASKLSGAPIALIGSGGVIEVGAACRWAWFELNIRCSHEPLRFIRPILEEHEAARLQYVHHFSWKLFVPLLLERKSANIMPLVSLLRLSAWNCIHIQIIALTSSVSVSLIIQTIVRQDFMALCILYLNWRPNHVDLFIRKLYHVQHGRY